MFNSLIKLYHGHYGETTGHNREKRVSSQHLNKFYIQKTLSPSTDTQTNTEATSKRCTSELRLKNMGYTLKY